MITIRKAILSDLLDVVSLGYSAVTSKTWQGVKDFDPKHVIHVTTDLIVDGLVFIAIADNRPVGMHVLHAQGWVWSARERFLESLILYVEPEYRAGKDENGVGASSALIEAAQNLADAIGIKLVLPLMWGDEKTVELRDEYVRRLGLEYVGGTFVYTPTDQATKVAAE